MATRSLAYEITARRANSERWFVICKYDVVGLMRYFFVSNRRTVSELRKDAPLPDYHKFAEVSWYTLPPGARAVVRMKMAQTELYEDETLPGGMKAAER